MESVPVTDCTPRVTPPSTTQDPLRGRLWGRTGTERGTRASWRRLNAADTGQALKTWRRSVRKRRRKKRRWMRGDPRETKVQVRKRLEISIELYIFN